MPRSLHDRHAQSRVVGAVETARPAGGGPAWVSISIPASHRRRSRPSEGGRTPAVPNARAGCGPTTRSATRTQHQHQRRVRDRRDACFASKPQARDQAGLAASRMASKRPTPSPSRASRCPGSRLQALEMDDTPAPETRTGLRL